MVRDTVLRWQHLSRDPEKVGQGARRPWRSLFSVGGPITRGWGGGKKGERGTNSLGPGTGRPEHAP